MRHTPAIFWGLLAVLVIALSIIAPDIAVPFGFLAECANAASRGTALVVDGNRDVIASGTCSADLVIKPGAHLRIASGATLTLRGHVTFSRNQL